VLCGPPSCGGWQGLKRPIPNEEHVGRAAATGEELARVTQAAFGAGRELLEVTRLRGATKKGVYRAAFDDGGTAIVYLWSPAENYWPAEEAEPGADPDDLADPFSAASGLSLFLAARARLDAIGVRTPRLYLADDSHRLFSADLAVVEDVPGPTLEALAEQDPAAARPVLEQLAAALRLMHAERGPAFGKLAHIDSGGHSTGLSCPQVVLDRATLHLAQAAARDQRIGQARSQLAAKLAALAATVEPRADFRLIHGELDPSHVLIDQHGRPVIIDIEGLLYFDLEWEHVFLRLRYGSGYQLLAADLDPHRMDLYALALYLSLVAGPLRLLDGDYPDRGPMLDIASQNARRALAML
jgi:hypothetical protein